MDKKVTTREEEIRHSRQLFEAVCDNATAAIFLLNDRQQCIYMNSAAEELTGYSLAEVSGRPLHDVIHHTRPDGSPYPLKECPIDRAFPQNVKEQGEEIFVHKDGHFYSVAYSASPIREEGTMVGTIIEVRDIEEDKAHQKALEDESQTLETLNRTGAMLAAKLDTADIVQAVTDAATALSGAQFGAFFYNSVNAEGELYQLYTLSGASREAFEKYPMPRNTKVFGPTFRGESVTRSDDITTDTRYGHNPPYKGMPPGHLPVRSYLAVPVISRTGEVLGGLFFGHEEPGVFNERAERVVVGIAAQAAIAIDNAHLFQQVQTELEERRRAEEVQKFLNDELNHRVKNMLATVQAVAAQTLRGAPAEEREAFEDRLLALSRAHSLLLRENWEGASLRKLARMTLEPFGGEAEDSPHCRVRGEEISLRPKQALALAMALHELGTNAAKYGALSNGHGQIDFSWRAEATPEGKLLRLRWQERGGPAVKPPRKRGFGSRLIERGLGYEIGGSVQIDYEPAGVVCVIDMPVPDKGRA